MHICFFGKNPSRSLFATLLLLALGPLVRPALADSPNIILAGDSIVLGKQIDAPRWTFSHLLQGAGFRVHDLSRDGERATRMLAELPMVIDLLDGRGTPLPGSVDAVVVMLGTNDYAQAVPLDVFRAAWRSFAQRTNVPVLCVTPMWRADDGRRNAAGLTLDDYRRVIRKRCPGRVVEGTDLVPGERSRVQTTAPTRFTVDGLHLNRIGHRRAYWHLREVLEEILLP